MPTKMFKIIDFKMSENQREDIMDMVKNTIEKDLDTPGTLTEIKKKLDFKYKAKWSVICGQKFTTFLDPKFFVEYMWVNADQFTYLIFRKFDCQWSKSVKKP